MTFINYSNHPSDGWNVKQKEAAQCWGEIVDMQFPNVAPEWTKEQVAELAYTEAALILRQHPAAVMCQGEFTLTYQLVKLLQERGVTVVSACSRRVAKEQQEEDGSVIRVSVFDFVGFREY